MNITFTQLKKIFRGFLSILSVSLIFATIGYFLISLYLQVTYLSYNLSFLSAYFEIILNIIVLLYETFALLFLCFLFIILKNAIQIYEQEKQFTVTSYPSLSICIPVNEPDLFVLKQTFNGLSNINYPRSKFTLFLGDDTLLSPLKESEQKKLKQILPFEYIYKPENTSFKAGMMNILIEEAQSEYIIFLDYDHIIMKDFPLKSITILENNKNLSYVQAKVNFRNIQSYIQKWQALMYVLFFEVFNISTLRESNVLFNGSTCCFRKTSLKRIGGVPESSITEDISLSLLLILSNKEGYLIDEYGSYGLVPTQFSLVLSQVLRWAEGCMQNLRLYGKSILKGDLSGLEKIDILSNLSVFLLSSSLLVESAVILLVYGCGYNIIRIEYVLSLSLLIPFVVFSLSILFASIGSVINIRKNRKIDLYIKDIPLLLYLFLVLNPFTIYTFFIGFVLYKKPDKSHTKWNRDIPIGIISILSSAYGSLLLSLGIYEYIKVTEFTAFSLYFIIFGLFLFLTYPTVQILQGRAKHDNPYLSYPSQKVGEE